MKIKQEKVKVTVKEDSNRKLFPASCNLSSKKGFTLLFAILISVLVLAVGTSMITIALKQVILSGAGRESQYAFYAANTGVECAVYWDLHGPQLIDGVIEYVFPPPEQTRLSDLSLEEVKCGGGKLVTGEGFIFGQNYTGPWNISNTNTTVFRLAITNDINSKTSDLQYCAEVTVEKEEVNDVVLTTITSQGLNNCDPDNNSRTVQRGLVIQYES